MIRHSGRLVVVALALVVTFGCSAARSGEQSRTAEDNGALASQSASPLRPEQSARLRIWSGRLGLEVDNLQDASAAALSRVKDLGGFVESESEDSESSRSLELRIPSANFRSGIEQLERLGSVRYKNVESEDITEQYVDVEARLANQIALRDRLKALLSKAISVTDVVAIETELTRIQSDIDSMQAKFKALKGQVDYAQLRLSLTRTPIRGPLGVLFDAVAWAVEKLFVIRD